MKLKKNVHKWNIHIHAIIYGRFLDNRIRGRCFDCNQNLIKYDYFSKNYYCANRKCNSLNVVHHKDSSLVELWKNSNKEDVNIHISRQGSSLFTLNYMLKYITMNKENFSTNEDIAEYIFSTRKIKLISSFGLFYKVKIPKYKHICPRCNMEVSYVFEFSVIDAYVESLNSISNNLFDYV